MRFEDLERLLQPRMAANAADEYKRFCAETGCVDTSIFLDRLVARGLLTLSLRAAVQADIDAATNDIATQGDAEAAAAAAADPRTVNLKPPGTDEENTRRPPPDFSHYDCKSVLGQGGMGCVYLAADVQLGRKVAFKQLLDTRRPVVRDRFLREAQITAQLDHPNIVPIYLLEVSSDGKQIGYAMKLVEGKTLSQLMREAATLYIEGKPLDNEHALETRLEHFLKVCDALAFAHSRNILHRDLKPANIMIGRFNEVYVMDWGIARRAGHAEDSVEDAAAAAADNPSSGEPELTRSGQVIGTAQYMSPEQARGLNRDLDARSDQYALGIILFELVALRRAIPGQTSDEALARAAEGKKYPMVHLKPGEPIRIELRAIVDKATALRPEDRYESVAALADDVRRFLRGEAVHARPDNPLQRLFRWVSRHRQATLVAVLSALLLAAGAVGLSLYRQQAARLAAEQQRAADARRAAAAELAAHERGARITAFLGKVSEQAHRIDGEFVKMERALEGLRTAAIWALAGPEPRAEDAPLYFDDDFAQAPRRPPDFGKTSYRWPVSLAYPVVGLSPEARAKKQQLLPVLRRLSPLRLHMRRMFVEAATGGQTLPAPEEERHILENREGPISYAYVCLPEGVIFMLPGYDALPPGYDVRTAGFYKMSDHEHGKRWGAPYIDSTTDESGDDLVLPCTEGLWSAAGEFLGVAGVEITVTKMVESALVLRGTRTLRQSLLRADGKKIIDTDDAGKRFKSNGKDEGLELVDFDVPEVVAAVAQGGSGVLEVERGGKKELVAYVPLDVIGWVYVVEVDAAMFDAKVPPTT